MDEDEEETKEFELRKSQLLNTNFEGSDDEPYADSEDEQQIEEDSDMLRDDLSLSDTEM